jgi:hypothetical protein
MPEVSALPERKSDFHLQEVLAGAARSRRRGAAEVGSLESIDRALEAGHPAFAASWRRESFRVSRDVK